MSSKEEKKVIPHQLQSFDALPFEDNDDLSKQVRIPITFESMPPGAIEERSVGLMFLEGKESMETRKFKLRIHTHDATYEYNFELDIEVGA